MTSLHPSQNSENNLQFMNEKIFALLSFSRSHSVCILRNTTQCKVILLEKELNLCVWATLWYTLTWNGKKNNEKKFFPPFFVNIKRKKCKAFFGIFQSKNWKCWTSYFFFFSPKFWLNILFNTEIHIVNHHAYMCI